NRRTDEQTNRRTDEQTNRRTEGQTNRGRGTTLSSPFLCCVLLFGRGLFRLRFRFQRNGVGLGQTPQGVEEIDGQNDA
ncbi:MAG: hypothetical protein EI684_05520, partial [Candidatus Viridilinea halotolerans]